MDFQLQAPFSPSGDQPEAIEQLVKSLNQGVKNQTLLGVTGSGKTFTIANVLKEVKRPALVISHNKTLAAQLYSEFKEFFPDNAVEYFVSYYDYYQPEAYIPSTNTYIEKDLSINEEIERLRLSTTSSLLSGRKDIIVVSSVSCIYGIGNPEEFAKNTIHLHKDLIINRNQLLHKFVSSLYSRIEGNIERGKFRVKGDIVDIFPAYGKIAYRLTFWGDAIETIESIDIDGHRIESLNEITIYPANIFVTSQDIIHEAIKEIQIDLEIQKNHFKSIGKHLEAKRLEDRVVYDIEMIKELGYCSGIENYSRYFDRRETGMRPFCLLDYFPKDFIFVVDESHVTIPQLKGMYAGDKSRKTNLVNYGFRLPAALDNRPLRLEEVQAIIGQTIYISATPADFELKASEGAIVEQIVRPTGLLDPIIEVRPCINQVDNLLEEIDKTIQQGERVLVTTLTKRMAEELTKYLKRIDVKTQYIHSDVDTLERVEILDYLREGIIDVIVGVNLLREGLDLPEVSLVAILDADKEGFLRSERSLTQTAGRAARNVNGRVIFYADTITQSMQKTINETNRRREKQIAYNIKNNISPTTIQRSRKSLQSKENTKTYSVTHTNNAPVAAEESKVKYLSVKETNNLIKSKEKAMEMAVKSLDFLEAARLRDEIKELKKNKGT